MPNFERALRDYTARPMECQCQRCPTVFTAMVVTRQPSYCDPCKAARKKQVDDESHARMIATRERPKLKPMPRLVPYAGYDDRDCRMERAKFYTAFRK